MYFESTSLINTTKVVLYSMCIYSLLTFQYCSRQAASEWSNLTPLSKQHRSVVTMQHTVCWPKRCYYSKSLWILISIPSISYISCNKIHFFFSFFSPSLLTHHCEENLCSKILYACSLQPLLGERPIIKVYHKTKRKVKTYSCNYA